MLLLTSCLCLCPRRNSHSSGTSIGMTCWHGSWTHPSSPAWYCLTPLSCFLTDCQDRVSAWLKWALPDYSPALQWVRQSLHCAQGTCQVWAQQAEFRRGAGIPDIRAEQGRVLVHSEALQRQGLRVTKKGSQTSRTAGKVNVPQLVLKFPSPWSGRSQDRGWDPTVWGSSARHKSPGWRPWKGRAGFLAGAGARPPSYLPLTLLPPLPPPTAIR